MKLDLVI